MSKLRLEVRKVYEVCIVDENGDIATYDDECGNCIDGMGDVPYSSRERAYKEGREWLKKFKAEKKRCDAFWKENQ